MKKVLFIVLMTCMSLMSWATTYYVSNSGSDSNSGLSTSLPWKTLAKVNATSFRPGDQILFQRGNTFYGSLTINQSGTSASPITFGAYGTGTNPEITGFTRVTAWKNLGNNIWESTNTVSTLSVCNMVTINGVNTAMGKFPNENDPNKGYLVFDSYSNTSITSSSLSGTSFVGAEVVLRIRQYSLNRQVITRQSGGTISWTEAINIGSTVKPFFIQNSIRTLDQQNEWYYNPTTKKISIYSQSQPVNVRVASVDKLVSIGNAVKYIIIDNLSFSGANINAIYRWPFGSEAERAKYITIKNCNISFSGEDAIFVKIDHLNIENNAISNSNGNSIVADASKYLVVRNNTIVNTAVLKGMTKGSEAPCALRICNVVNALIEYNRMVNSGYNGINFSQKLTDSLTIQNNYIDSFCTVLNDGGGIYGNRNAKILNNIILNGAIGQIKVGNYDPFAIGIYIDDNSFNLEVSGNTVSGCDRIGIYLHNTSRSKVNNNLCFNNKFWQLITKDDVNIGQIADNIITNNVFISKSDNYRTVEYHWGDGSTSTIGTLNNNYYCRPIKEGSEIYSNSQRLTVVQWQKMSGQDANSRGSAQAVNSENDMKLYYNDTKSSKVIALSQPMIDVKGNIYSGNITLQPFTSTVLMRNNNPADITSFTLPGQTGTTVINSSSKTVTVTMPNGVSLSSLKSSFSLSSGATAKIGTVSQVSGTTANNFINPIVYTVTAQDGVTTKNWTITATNSDGNSQSPKSADFISFTLPGQIGNSVINSSTKTIEITMPYGLSLDKLAASFTVPSGTTVKVGTALQVSGSTWHNFAVPVFYMVTTAEGTSAKWTVSTKVSSGAEFITFTLPGQIGNSVINSRDQTIEITMPSGLSLATLAPTFSLTPGAVARVGTAIQRSESTWHNFAVPVPYIVTAKDGVTTKKWIVTVTVSGTILKSQTLSASLLDTVIKNEGLAIKNYPNPFVDYTTFEFSLTERTNVLLEVYDSQGKKVIEIANQDYEPGMHRFTWDGKNQNGQAVSPGLYIYNSRVGNSITSKKIIYQRF